MNPNKDKLRTVHSSNLILSYCKFLTKKVEFNKKWNNFVEGNHINLFFNCFLNTFQYIEDKNILIIFLTIIIYDKGSILVLNFSGGTGVVLALLKLPCVTGWIIRMNWGA